MTSLLKEKVLIILALLLCVATSVFAILEAPDLFPVAVVYSEVPANEKLALGESPSQEDCSKTTQTADESETIQSISEESETIQSTSKESSADNTTSVTVKQPSKININAASKTQLMELKGVGESVAQRIIDYRSMHGKFHSIEELKQISGIGEKRFSAIREYISVK